MTNKDIINGLKALRETSCGKNSKDIIDNAIRTIMGGNMEEKTELDKVKLEMLDISEQVAKLDVRYRELVEKRKALERPEVK